MAAPRACRAVLALCLLFIPTASLRITRVRITKGGCNVDGRSGAGWEMSGRKDFFVCNVGQSIFDCSTLKSHLQAFLEIYKKRPNKKNSNKGGIGFYHAFYLYTIIQELQPKHLIESGIFHGVGTWFLRQACPECQITCISPENPQIYRDEAPDSRYFTGKKFKDFNDIDWKSLGMDQEKTLIFFDDHQAGIKRAMQARAKGFRHITFDDNYVGAGGDNYSLKKTCDPEHILNEGKPAIYTDDFFKKTHALSADESTKLAEQMREAVDIYYEMPPVWLPSKLPPRLASSPHFREYTQKQLLSDAEAKELEESASGQLNLVKESSLYTHFPYVRLRK